MQKEAYWASVPCITLRDETEWVELVDAGVNHIVGTDKDSILEAVSNSRNVNIEHSKLYGDGNAAQRIVEIIANY